MTWAKRKTARSKSSLMLAKPLRTAPSWDNVGCLLALDRLLTRGKRPQRVLDVGTGSAILAIGAAKTGSRVVVGTEIDPRANYIAGLNAKLNRVGPKVRTYVANGVRAR